MDVKIYTNGVEAILKRKSVKNIYLKICLQDGEIMVSAPFRMKLDEIKKFVLSKLNWIEKKQENIKKNSLKYLSNEIHYFRGDKYTLKFDKVKKNYLITCSLTRFSTYVTDKLLNIPVFSIV